MFAHENPQRIEIHALLTLDCIYSNYICVGDFFVNCPHHAGKKAFSHEYMHSVCVTHTILPWLWRAHIYTTQFDMHLIYISTRNYAHVIDDSR